MLTYDVTLNFASLQKTASASALSLCQYNNGAFEYKKITRVYIASGDNTQQTGAFYNRVYAQ